MCVCACVRVCVCFMRTVNRKGQIRHHKPSTVTGRDHHEHKDPLALSWVPLSRIPFSILSSSASVLFEHKPKINASKIFFNFFLVGMMNKGWKDMKNCCSLVLCVFWDFSELLKNRIQHFLQVTHLIFLWLTLSISPFIMGWAETRPRL